MEETTNLDRRWKTSKTEIRSALKVLSSSLDADDVISKDATSRMYQLHKNLSEFNFSVAEKIHLMNSQILLEENGITILTKVFGKLMHLYLKSGKISANGISTLQSLLAIFVDCTNRSEEFSEHLCQEEGFLCCLIKFQCEYKNGYFAQTLTKEVNDILRDAIIVPYNCVYFGSTTILKNMRNVKMIDSVQPFIDLPNADDLQLVALLFCTYAAKEKEVTYISTKVVPIQNTINLLKLAVQASNKRENGWSSIELGQGIERLAKNNSKIKRQIVDQGIVPVLQLMLKSKMAEESEIAFRTIWTLSFDWDTKERLKNDFAIPLKQPCLPDMFTKGKLQTDEEFSNVVERVDKARQGAKFVIEDVNDEDPRPHCNNNQVMISYCHQNKTIVHKINDQLQALGFKTWIDTEQMQGSILEAMANAVQNSSVVLFFISSKYKTSQACQTEAEYAYKRRKTLIPILTEEKYKPDDWLGALVGTKLFYDFSGNHDFENIFDNLTNALAKELNNTKRDNSESSSGPNEFDPNTSAAETVVTDSDVKSSDASKVETSRESKLVIEGAAEASMDTGTETITHYETFTTAQVKDWLKKNDIKKTKRSLNGPDLKYLKQLKEEDVQGFHRRLEKMFFFKNCQQFVTILDDLH